MPQVLKREELSFSPLELFAIDDRAEALSR